jgi:adenylate cyclase
MADPPDTTPGESDFEQAGLLNGLDGEARGERVALLRYLAEDGATVEDLQRATRDGTLMFLPAERTIGGPGRYTLGELAEQADMDMDTIVRLRQAMGVPIPEPGARELTDTDIEGAKLARAARDAGIHEDEILDVTRVLSRGLSQAAEVMRAITMRLVLQPGISERELAERYAQAAAGLTPMTGPLVNNLLTLHLRNLATGEAISAAERSGGQLPGSREVAVSFADLVGFTRVGEEVPPDELGRMAARLETLTSENVRPPVRLVKTIGDAAMLVSSETAPLLDASLALVDAADAEGADFPQLRVGIARGTALSRAGDWFGRPVNMASRITAVARPGSVLTSRDVRDAARDAYRWSSAGERRLKGIREPVALFRARREAPDRDDGG